MLAYCKRFAVNVIAFPNDNSRAVYVIFDITSEMEEATVREEKFHIYLNDDEYSRVIQSLMRLKNNLIAQGRYTDGVDDVLCKVLSAKKRKLKIIYI